MEKKKKKNPQSCFPILFADTSCGCCSGLPAVGRPLTQPQPLHMVLARLFQLMFLICHCLPFENFWKTKAPLSSLNGKCSSVVVQYYAPPTHPLQRQGYALHLNPRWQLPPTWLLLLWPTPVPGSLLDSWPTPTPSSRLATCRIPDLCFFCPALYLPSTTTVSTGASLRPSAWGSGRFAQGSLALISSCCHAVSLREGVLVYKCSFSFDFDQNSTHDDKLCSSVS